MGLPLLRVERHRVDRLVLGIQSFIGPQPGEKLGDLGQCFVVGRPQLRRIGDAVEVAHHTPGAPQFFRGDIQHTRNVLPACWERRRGDGLQRGVGFCQQSVHGRRHMLRPNLIKKWEVVELEKRVHAMKATGLVNRVSKNAYSNWRRRQGFQAPAVARSAASRVLTSNIVMVMGPTPPGTGVM